MCDFTLRAQRRRFTLGAAGDQPGNQSGAGALAGTLRRQVLHESANDDVARPGASLRGGPLGLQLSGPAGKPGARAHRDARPMPARAFAPEGGVSGCLEGFVLAQGSRFEDSLQFVFLEWFAQDEVHARGAGRSLVFGQHLRGQG